MHFPTVAELCPDPATLSAMGISETDLQGWNSNSPVFEKLINQIVPATIIEVGSWKGASCLTMALARAKLAGDPAWKIYCVDHWLGGADHYLNQDKPENDLKRDEVGFPRIYHQFIYNVATTIFAPRVHPITQTSISGARILGRANITADLIYIDASHVYEDVYADLQNYSLLLADGGIMFGDDWVDFASVRLAVTRFAYEYGYALALQDQGWQLKKAA